MRRFLLPCGLLLVAAFCIYWSQAQESVRSGSSWQGYLLGCLAAALLVWLSALGVRKRRYTTADDIKAWVAAHMLLGLVVIVVVVLHSGGQLNWNVHSLSFVLLLLVVASGVVGCVFYLLLPQQLMRLRGGSSLKDSVTELRAADARCREISAKCSPDVDLAVGSAIAGTTLGGGMVAQLWGADFSSIKLAAGDIDLEPMLQKNTDQHALQVFLANAATESVDVNHVESLQTLLRLVARRQELLRRLRADIRMQSWLRVWLLVHAPLTAALLAAVLVHVFVVFFYW